MFRYSKKNMILSAMTGLAVLTLASAAELRAQQSPEADPQSEVTPDLWRLLNDWARGSSQIRMLHGKHERHVYDSAFEVEKISRGEFWYEAPDKGRIDVQPVEVTSQMLDARNSPEAKVERRKNGEPYELKSDSAERWICDGQRVFDINDPQKSARVVDLPPTLRGENIMNSPLPFLFGMPAQDAVKRFRMTLIRDYRPEYDVVLLEALPKWRQDADNWMKAEIFLNTKTFLPSAVKLIDPAETKRTVYTFQDLQANKVGLIQRLLGKNPWDPKIEGYQIHVIQAAEEQQQAAVTPTGPVMPNLLGKRHDEATNLLLEAGIPRENISKQNAGPAPRENLTYIVREQTPKPGAPFKQSEKIVLMIFDKFQG